MVRDTGARAVVDAAAFAAKDAAAPAADARMLPSQGETSPRPAGRPRTGRALLASLGQHAAAAEELAGEVGDPGWRHRLGAAAAQLRRLAAEARRQAERDAAAEG